MNINGIEFVKHEDGYWIPTDNGYVENALRFAVEDAALDKIMIVENLGEAIVIHAVCEAKDYNSLSKVMLQLRDGLREHNFEKSYGVYITPTYADMHSLGGVENVS